MLGSAVTFNGFTINNRASQPLLHAQAPFYYIMLKNVDGLTNADISYESYPLPQVVGEKSGDVWRRGKTITLSGNVYGLNYTYLWQGVGYLQQMFASTAMHALAWTRTQDNIGVYINCRVNQDLSIVEGLDSDVYRIPWVVGLRADIPFTYKSSDSSLYPTWQQ